jgi:16S rRNA (guanine966-N2)-methyltransferase
MRIISGSLRGKTLLTPIDWDTRPTSDKARQGIFNIIEHAPWSDGLLGKNVLDVFAGTGAMGIEAASRGAAFVGFIENNPKATRVLEQNIKACRLEDSSKLIKTDATKLGALSKTLPKFDLVILDPPYGKDLLLPAISELIKGDWILDGAIIIAETKKGEELTPPPNTELLREVNYGINAFKIMRFI